MAPDLPGAGQPALVAQAITTDTPLDYGDGVDGASLMMRLDNDHHGTQMPLVSAVHIITVILTRR
jgi:hypothetical protein